MKTTYYYIALGLLVSNCGGSGPEAQSTDGLKVATKPVATALACGKTATRTPNKSDIPQGVWGPVIMSGTSSAAAMVKVVESLYANIYRPTCTKVCGQRPARRGECEPRVTSSTPLSTDPSDWGIQDSDTDHQWESWTTGTGTAAVHYLQASIKDFPPSARVLQTCTACR